MPHTLFISDLHLGPEHPAVLTAFHKFLAETAPHAAALFILGDLFEAWAGDDDLEDPFNRQVISALAKLSGSGTTLYLMHGNRDFLMGTTLADACGARLLSDPCLLDIHGTRTLLTHGDTLCTDDLDYLAFRAQVRDPVWQERFLGQPLARRKAIIEQLRAQSRQAQSLKQAEIMDTNPGTVAQTLREYGYPRLIHGHTHRPAQHVHEVDGHACERWVLPDWCAQGGYLRCDADGCAAVTI